MELPQVSDLTELGQLDRRNLHLFIAGPGTGEAIAIALPESGWIIVDSARAANGETPYATALREHFGLRDSPDPIHWAILTHPHTDHYGGFAEVLTPADDADKPRAVGISFCRDRSDFETLHSAQSASKGQRFETLLKALKAWEGSGEQYTLSCLIDANEPLVDSEGLTLRVLHPSKAALDAIYASNDPADALLGHGQCTNQVSVVLDIAFGDTRILLPGDLEGLKRNDERGWQGLASRFPDNNLAAHHGIKVPHHGSSNALSLVWLAEMDHARYWCLTPKSGHGLPKFAALNRLLQHEPALHVTARSAKRDLQRLAEPYRLTPQDFTKSGTPKAGAGARPRFDTLWCAAFDHEAQCVGRWRGSSALLIETSTVRPSCDSPPEG